MYSSLFKCLHKSLEIKTHFRTMWIEDLLYVEFGSRLRIKKNKLRMSHMSDKWIVNCPPFFCFNRPFQKNLHILSSCKEHAIVESSGETPSTSSLPRMRRARQSIPTYDLKRDHIDLLHDCLMSLDRESIDTRKMCTNARTLECSHENIRHLITDHTLAWDIGYFLTITSTHRIERGHDDAACSYRIFTEDDPCNCFRLPSCQRFCATPIINTIIRYTGPSRCHCHRIQFF